MHKTNNGNLSRHELLAWVNEELRSQYNKIEELCSGVAYCQLMYKLSPESIQLKKVKFNAKTEVEFINNLKLFQNALTKLGIEKDVSILKLVKGHFVDNFQFLQWFKKYYESKYDGRECNMFEIRESIIKEQERMSNLHSITPLKANISRSVSPINSNNCSNHNSKSPTVTIGDSMKLSPNVRDHGTDYCCNKCVLIRDLILKEEAKAPLEKDSVLKEILNIVQLSPSRIIEK